MRAHDWMLGLSTGGASLAPRSSRVRLFSALDELFTARSGASICFMPSDNAGRLPKIASNNRPAGTAEDNKVIVAGTLALFGTYSVDEAKRTLTYNIEASTFPNAEGTVQTRTIDLLTADEFRNSNLGASRDGPVVAMNVYRRAK